MVIKVDRAEKRIALSLKKLLRNPWNDLADRFKVNDMVDGQVTRLTQYGAFVDMGQGIEGLLPTSQLTSNPEIAITEGQAIRLCVTNVDGKRQRIGLSFQPINTDSAEPPMEPGESKKTE